jgi:hypothetical protein
MKLIYIVDFLIEYFRETPELNRTVPDSFTKGFSITAMFSTGPHMMPAISLWLKKKRFK